MKTPRRLCILLPLLLAAQLAFAQPASKQRLLFVNNRTVPLTLVLDDAYEFCIGVGFKQQRVTLAQPVHKILVISNDAGQGQPTLRTFTWEEVRAPATAFGKSSKPSPTVSKFNSTIFHFNTYFYLSW
jgi:hypothetical protein